MNAPHRLPRLFPLRLAAGLVAAALLAGCNLLPEAQPDNTRHYVLESGVVVPATGPTGTVRLGLRPVDVPVYLRQKSIVIRTGDNELAYTPDARWAEPIEAGITRLLREHLAARVRVLAYPFPAQLPRDYDLTVRILNAEGAKDGVQFVAVFELLRVGDRPEIVVRREFRTRGRPWNGDHGQLARVLSDAVAELADEIVAAVPQPPES